MKARTHAGIAGKKEQEPAHQPEWDQENICDGKKYDIGQGRKDHNPVFPHELCGTFNSDAVNPKYRLDGFHDADLGATNLQGSRVTVTSPFYHKCPDFGSWILRGKARQERLVLVGKMKLCAEVPRGASLSRTDKGVP